MSHPARTFFGILIFLGITGCLPKKTQETKEPGPVFLFQNAIGLNFAQAGCSLIDLGGIGRLCKKVEDSAPDLFLQVGPAFSFLINAPEDANNKKVSEWRKQLLELWSLARVSLYAVDGKDLEPSLEKFVADTSTRKIPFISTNIRSNTGATPFPLSHFVKIKNQEFLFLSFSAPGETGGDWKSLPLSEAVASVSEEVERHPAARLVLLGNLAPQERKELAGLFKRPTYLLGGPLKEMNPTQWIALSESSWWAKAADLGRGVGLIYWGGAASTAQENRFVAQGLHKDLDATNQCTELVRKYQPPESSAQ